MKKQQKETTKHKQLYQRLPVCNQPDLQSILIPTSTDSGFSNFVLSKASNSERTQELKRYKLLEELHSFIDIQAALSFVLLHHAPSDRKQRVFKVGVVNGLGRPLGLVQTSDRFLESLVSDSFLLDLSFQGEVPRKRPQVPDKLWDSIWL